MVTQSRPPTILLTRPLAQSQRFAEDIRKLGGKQAVEISPVLDIRALAVPAPAGEFSDLIFTSQQAAKIAPTLGFALPKHAFCVGEQTAEAARQMGFVVTVLGGDADGLVAALQAMPGARHLLHLHGGETRGDVAARLRAAGVAAQGLAIYDQPALPLTAAARQALAADGPVILPIFSPRTARIIADQGPFRAPIWVLAISQAVADACAALAPDRLETAQSPDAAAMLEGLDTLLRYPRP